MELEKLFENKSLLVLSLTHKSWVNEHPRVRESNERLEFLGDAILEFVVSKEIFANFPDKEEGYLTVLRANLVNTVNLAKVAQRLELGKKLYLSKGEEETGGRTNTSLLANTVEAIIGALYLDGGITKSESFIHEQLLAQIDETLALPLKDPKSRLQEIVQAQGLPAPRYEVVEENGPDHDKEFTIQVLVDGKPIAQGQGKNKSDAAQKAAEKGLELYES